MKKKDFQQSLPQSDVVVRAENLSVLIKERFLVKNATFTIKKGETWAVIGQDKSGKTSLIKAISGSLPIGVGQAFVGDVDIFLDKTPLQSVSTCFDPPVFFKYQTVLQNMRFLGGLSESNNRESILAVLKSFGLENLAHKRVKSLTYSQKKLMGLALGFLTKPQILLLDEPFKNLPKQSLKVVKNAINAIKKQGTTVVITSTNLQHLDEFCDHFIFMQDREIVRIATAEELPELARQSNFAFVKVNYPHYAGTLIMENFSLPVKLLDKRVLFDADEQTTAQILHFLGQKRVSVYRAGFINKKSEQIFANLAPYFKAENAENAENTESGENGSGNKEGKK